METLRATANVKTALAALIAAAIAALLLHGPIAQPESYHDFADARAWGPLPNAQNILSNALLLLGGMLGCAWYGTHAGTERSRAWLFVFVGAAATAFGSSWYHLAPSDSTLVWDRIPMGLAFTAYFIALLEDYVDPRVRAGWLLALFPLSALSIAYWHASGDLRGWVLVQALPLLATPLVLWLSPRRHAGARYLWIALACYALAKACELADGPLYALTAHALSGHAAKHLLAGAGVIALWRMLVDAERPQPRAVRTVSAAYPGTD